MEKEGLHFAREDEHARRWRYWASHACDGKAGASVTFPANPGPNFSAAWKLANLLRTLRKWKVGERRQHAGRRSAGGVTAGRLYICK